MFTVRIFVKDYLKEYISVKYGDCPNYPVRFPDSTDVYHLIWDLLEKRPLSVQTDKGNLEIILPVRYGSKNPAYYNYLGVRSQEKIARKLQILFWTDFREYIGYQRHYHGASYLHSTFEFIKCYGIRSISEDALLKNYYRWRKKCCIWKKNHKNEEKIR